MTSTHTQKNRFLFEYSSRVLVMSMKLSREKNYKTDLLPFFGFWANQNILITKRLTVGGGIRIRKDNRTIFPKINRPQALPLQIFVPIFWINLSLNSV
jgi:hypothetical protein